jgi:hypothetical protein
MKAVNSQTKHFVGVVSEGQELNADKRINLNSFLLSRAESTAPHVDEAYAGGWSDQLGNHTVAVIALDSKGVLTDNRTANDGVGNLAPSSLGELLAHELIGHNVGYSINGGKNHVSSIQVTNIYRRSIGNTQWRSGQGHLGNKDKLDKAKANGVPWWLEDEN